jgi:phenylacetate-CoA ligase
MIKGTSEKIYDSYQEEVKQAFGLKIISEYGAAEAGIIAFECPCGNMHINIENVIVEEENGEIIVTNLLSRSFPIIRYKLGDNIILSKSGFKCECGKNHPVIIDVLGRTGKKIIGYKHVYPSLTLYYVFKNMALNHNATLNYQAIQNERGHIILNIEQHCDSKIENYLRHELYKYFSNVLPFIFEIIGNCIRWMAN